MKVFKRSLIVVLSISLLLTLVVLPNATEDYFEEEWYRYTVSDGKATIVNCIIPFEAEITELTVSSELGGYPVTEIADKSFQNCDDQTVIILPDTVEIIGDYAFRECESLEKIVLSENLVSIGEYAFYCCRNLKEVFIPASVNSIGRSAFVSDFSLSEVKVDDNNECFSDIEGILFNKDKTELILYPIAVESDIYEIPSTVNKIAVGAFCGSKLKQIVIPESVTEICEDAFYNCRELTTINLPQGITELSDRVLSYCVELNSVTVPDRVKAIGDSAFSGCHSLKHIEMGDDIKTIGANAFQECVLLEEIDIGDKVTTIGQSAFYCCFALKDFEIPASVETIGSSAFARCSGLKEITIPSGVKCIGGNVFYCCGAMEKIEFEEGVAEIPEGGMLQCTSLNNVILPSTLKKVGARAFLDDVQLTDVYFNGTQEEWEAIEVAEENEPLLNATIHFAEDVRGDVNVDGFVNAADALLVLRHAVQSVELAGKSLMKADLTNDDIINSSDALMILRIAVGLEKSEPETKEEIAEFYNSCVQKSSKQNKIDVEGSTDLSFTVNKFLIDGKEDEETTKSYEEDLNAIEYDDVKFNFINGETEDGLKAEEFVLSAQMQIDEIDTASIAPHGDGYKITLTLYPNSYTLSEDELTGDFSNYKSYSEENSLIEVMAVTDGEGRIVLLDLHLIKRIKATLVEESIEFYLDFDVDQRDIYTFAY